MLVTVWRPEIWYPCAAASADGLSFQFSSSTIRILSAMPSSTDDYQIQSSIKANCGQGFSCLYYNFYMDVDKKERLCVILANWSQPIGLVAFRARTAVPASCLQQSRYPVCRHTLTIVCDRLLNRTPASRKLHDLSDIYNRAPSGANGDTQGLFENRSRGCEIRFYSKSWRAGASVPCIRRNIR